MWEMPLELDGSRRGSVSESLELRRDCVAEVAADIEDSMSPSDVSFV